MDHGKNRSRRSQASVFLMFLLLGCSLNQSLSQSPVFACDVSKNPDLKGYGFCDIKLGIGQRVQDLVKQLTLQEKVALLVNKAGAVNRLGIPAYNWWSEALHGVSSWGTATRFTNVVPGATSFPQVILLAASFNTSLFEAIGKVVSTEARAMYNVGLSGLTYWSPNINIFRDPRWGRGQETPGEDPLLSSKFASSYVRGLQQTDGKDSDRLKVAACCKHYTAYDLDSWKGVDRYHFSAQVTKQDMDDTFQPPFQSCVEDGNAASVMCSYNQVNGVPTCADPSLLGGTIRGKWRLNGYIVSDCDSVKVLFSSQHYAKTPEDAAAESISAGLDLNCGSFLAEHTEAAIHAGKINNSAIDNALANNLAVLMRLGFFDGDPTKQPYGNLGPKDICTQEHQDLALDAARQGIVLLKNSPGSLPLSAKSIKSLAVIGPNANATKTMTGDYDGPPCKFTTPLMGLAGHVSNIHYEPGCANVACSSAQVESAQKAASQADATIVIVGSDQNVESESLDRIDLHLPGQQELLITEVAKAANGRPVVLVVMSGGPMDISTAKADQNVTSILWVGFPGEAGGAAIADVVFGLFNPSGRLPMTWYPQAFVDKVPMTNMNMRPNPASGYPGRTYRFYTGEYVYLFGDGLSYTNFTNHMVKAPELVSVSLGVGHVCHSKRCKSVEVEESTCQNLRFDVHMQIRNVGSTHGTHTVLFFSTPPQVHDAPSKQLLGFERVALEAGETQLVKFRLDVCKHLSVVDELGIRRVPLGSHILHAGSLKHSLNVSIK